MKIRQLLALIVILGFLVTPGGSVSASGASPSRLAADINPGSDGSYPGNLYVYNSKLYFAAYDGVHGTELWKYDGNTASMVQDINPDGDSLPSCFAAYNGSLYFVADDGAGDNELWKYDGTTVSMVVDTGRNTIGMCGLTVYDGALYFYSNYQLWKYDGTSASVIPNEIDPYGRVTGNLIVFQDKLYFAESTNSVGTIKGLGVFDGSHMSMAGGTWSGEVGGSSAIYQNALYFDAFQSDRGDELWKFDGTNVSLVPNPYPANGWHGSEPSDLTVFNGALYFNGREGDFRMMEKYDGTKITIVPWSCPGGNGFPELGPYPSELTVYHGALYFQAYDCNDWQGSLHGIELWKLDRSDHFSLVADICPGRCSSDPWALQVFNDTLYFRADDGAHGSELWKYQTLLAAPTLLAPLNGATPLSLRPSFRWTSSAGATGYNVQISRSATFGTLVQNARVSGITFTPAVDLPSNTPLYWRVRAVTATANGAWSSTWSLTTPNPPSTPVLLKPGNGALTRNYAPTFDWADSTLPEGTTFAHYQIQIDTHGNFSAPLVNTTTAEGDITTSAYVPSSSLAANTTYYWRVRSYNALGQYSPWSPRFSLRTALPVPTLINPADSALLITRQPTFKWTTVPGATSYGIQVSRNTLFTTLVANNSLATNIFRPGTPLPARVTLYWRVQARGPNPSAWSPYWSFTTP